MLDTVVVNCNSESIRNNRLVLLKDCCEVFDVAFDFSKVSDKEIGHRRIEAV